MSDYATCIMTKHCYWDVFFKTNFSFAQDFRLNFQHPDNAVLTYVSCNDYNGIIALIVL